MSKKRIEREYAKKNELSIYYQNIRGTKTKHVQLSQNISASDYDIILFSETWLTPDFSNSALKFDDFDIFRCDRSVLSSPHARGGGVLIASRTYLNCCLLTNHFNSIEQVWILLNTQQKQMLFGCVYIPPNSNNILYENFGNSLHELHERYSDAELYIFGDFNLPNIS